MERAFASFLELNQGASRSPSSQMQNGSGAGLRTGLVLRRGGAAKAALHSTAEGSHLTVASHAAPLLSQGGVRVRSAPRTLFHCRRAYFKRGAFGGSPLHCGYRPCSLKICLRATQDTNSSIRYRCKRIHVLKKQNIATSCFKIIITVFLIMFFSNLKTECKLHLCPRQHCCCSRATRKPEKLFQVYFFPGDIGASEKGISRLDPPSRYGSSLTSLARNELYRGHGNKIETRPRKKEGGELG